MSKSEKKNRFDEMSLNTIRAVGGVKNIKDITHCATRLRIVVFDDELVNKNELESLELAKAVIFSGGQWQIVFGAGTVNKVYDKAVNNISLEQPLNSSEKASNVSYTKTGKEPWWNSDYTFGSNAFTITRRVAKNFGDIFIPLIPIFIAAGVSLAFKIALETLFTHQGNFIVGFESLLGIIADTLFGMLPVFIAWSMMKKLGGPEVYGIGIGLILVSTSLVSMGSVQTPISIGLHSGESLVSLAEANGWIILDVDNNINSIFIDGSFKAIGDSLVGSNGIIYTITQEDLTAEVAYLFNYGEYTSEFIVNAVVNNASYSNINDMAIAYVSTYKVLFNGIWSISLIGYQSQIVAALLSTAVIYWIYKAFVAIMPEAIAIIFVPLLTFIFATWAILWVVGPFGRILNSLMVSVFNGIYANLNFVGFGLGTALLASVLPLLVITGLHNSLIIVEMTTITDTLAQYGHSFTYNTPMWFSVHAGISGSVLAYFFISKNQKAKSVAMSGVVPVNLGISEPALYGTCVRLGYPLVAGIIGAFISGLWVGGTGTLATINGSASWIGLVQFDWIPCNESPEYLTFTTDAGMPTLFNGLSNGIKIVIALIIGNIAGFIALIIISNTQWAKSINRSQNEETLTYSELIYMFTPSKTLPEEDLYVIYKSKAKKDLTPELEEAFKKKAKTTSEIYQLKLSLKRSKHDFKIYEEILENNIKISEIKSELKLLTKYQKEEKEKLKSNIKEIKQKINSLNKDYKKSESIPEKDVIEIKDSISAKQSLLEDTNKEIKSL